MGWCPEMGSWQSSDEGSTAADLEQSKFTVNQSKVRSCSVTSTKSPSMATGPPLQTMQPCIKIIHGLLVLASALAKGCGRTLGFLARAWSRALGVQASQLPPVSSGQVCQWLGCFETSSSWAQTSTLLQPEGLRLLLECDLKSEGSHSLPRQMSCQGHSLVS